MKCGCGAGAGARRQGSAATGVLSLGKQQREGRGSAAALTCLLRHDEETGLD